MSTPTVDAWLSTSISKASVGVLGGDSDSVDALRGARPRSLLIVGTPKIRAKTEEGTNESSAPIGAHRAGSLDVVVLQAPIRGASRAVAEALRLTRARGRLIVVCDATAGGSALRKLGEILREAATEFEFEPPLAADGRIIAVGRRPGGEGAGARLEASRSWLGAALELQADLEGSRERVDRLTAAFEATNARLEGAEEDVDNVRAAEAKARLRLEQLLAAERTERERDVESLVEARRELYERESDLRVVREESAASIEELDGAVSAQAEALDRARRELGEAQSQLVTERAKAEAAEGDLAEARQAILAAERARSRIAEAAPEAWRGWLTDELVETQRRLTYEIGRNAELMSGRAMRAQRAMWRARQSRRTRLVLAAGSLILVAGLLAAAFAIGGGAVAGVLAAFGLAAAVFALVGRARRRRDRPVPRVPARSHAIKVPTTPSAGVAKLPESVAVARPAPGGAVTVDTERRRWMAKLDRTPVPVADLRIAGIADEITTSCLEPDCDWKAVPTEWQDLLSSWHPDILFVESAWAGNEGQWQYQVGSYGHPTYRGLPRLRALLEWCDRNEIPTVFWNKEDPVHFDRFKEAAALFKHVFTTDANRVDAYRELGGRTETVDPLPFAAQPQIHNPTRLSTPRSPAPCFAGTYYNDRHRSRRKSLEDLLDAALPHGLVIYDRMHGSAGDNYVFPERFRSHIVGRLPYDRLIDVYKGHDVFLNVNSVVDSPTMFSRRVFELLACDTAVLSTDSAGIRSIFADTVPIAESLPEASNLLERLMANFDWRTETVRRARRLILREHTYRRRLETVARRCGLEVEADPDLAAACLVVLDGDSSPAEVGSLIDQIRSQSGAVTELIVGAPEGSGQVDGFADGGGRARVVDQDPLTPRGERYAELAKIATAPWVVPVAPGRELDPHHVEDLASCARFTDADVVGRPLAMGSTSVVEQAWAQFVDPRAAFARRVLVAQRGWPDASEAAEWMARRFREGARLYAADSPAEAGLGTDGLDAAANSDRTSHQRIRSH